jgi:WD40 repeat protein
VWDVKSGCCLFYVPQEGDLFISTALSPDGKVLATGSDEIILLDAATGEALQSLKGYANHPYQLAFSPDGKTLASASDDGTVLIWDIS